MYLSLCFHTNTIVASLGLAYAVNQAGQGVLSALPQDTNQSDIVCNTLTAYSSITSDNIMSTRTLNSNYGDIRVSWSANRLYTHCNIYSQAVINAFDGFRLTSKAGATNYYYTQMDAVDKMLII